MKRAIAILIAFTTLAITSIKAQENSVRVNIPSLAFGNINADVSFRLSNRTSLHLQGQVNPFDFKVPAPIELIHLSSRKINISRIMDWGLVDHSFNVTFQPGVRFWFNGVYNRGIFLGSNIVASMYKLGGDRNDVFYRKGYALGGALSVGYSYELATFWNIEAEIGMGIFYNKYHNLREEVKGKGFFNGELTDITVFPNRLSISIAYLF